MNWIKPLGARRRLDRDPKQNKAIASTYVRALLDPLTDDARQPFLVLLGAVGLIACANRLGFSNESLLRMGLSLCLSSLVSSFLAEAVTYGRDSTSLLTRTLDVRRELFPMSPSGPYLFA